MIQLLVQMGADPVREDSLKQTPLFYACREGNTKAIAFLISDGRDNINRQDKYGQTPIYYCIREGHIHTTQQLIDLGAMFDHCDTKNQRPVFYAIQHNKFEMVKFLLDKGADLQLEDKKGVNPTLYAKKQNRLEILSLLLDRGGQLSDPRKQNQTNNRKPQKQATVPEVKPVVNERKIPRRYTLTTLREGGYYSPMTDQEFEEFKRAHPEMARYFELNDNDEDLQPISQLQVPEVPESAPIYDQWEKAAQRMLTTLNRNQKTYIFANPVDWQELKIPDYPNVVKNPMDFGTIKGKLREHKYERIQEFMEDMELVFYNCRLYNGTESDVGQIGVQVQ